MVGYFNFLFNNLKGYRFDWVIVSFVNLILCELFFNLNIMLDYLNFILIIFLLNCFWNWVLIFLYMDDNIIDIWIDFVIF